MKYYYYNVLPFLLLLFLMIIIPSGYQFLKGILIIIILFQFIFKTIIKFKLDINKKIFIFFIIYVLIGLLYGIYGFLRGNPGAIPTTKIIVIYPIIYMIFINQINNLRSWEFVNKIIIVSSFLLCLYIIATIANSFGVLPDYLYISLETEDTNADVNTSSLGTYGRLYASFSSLPLLMFLQPYLFNIAITSQNLKLNKLTWITFILMSIIMCLVGRRILLIISLIFPILIYLFHRKYNLKSTKIFNNKKKLVYFVLLFILIIILIINKLEINLLSMWEHFLFSFQFEQLSSDGTYVENIRIETFNHLIKGWIKSPIFGYGSGSYDPNFYRNPIEPWNYEITYIYLLYSFGLFGIIVYSYGIFYISKTCIQIFKKNNSISIYAISSFFGMIAFLLGTATNPYLLKFESLMIIFIPVMIINLYKKY